MRTPLRIPRHESALRPIPCKLDISEFAPRLDLGELLKDLLRVDPHKHQASGLVQKRLAVLVTVGRRPVSKTEARRVFVQIAPPGTVRPCPDANRGGPYRLDS